MMKEERWKIYDQDLFCVDDKIYCMMKDERWKIYDQDLLYVGDNIHDKIYCVLMIRFIVWWKKKDER
jgi:hypothetical protein